MAAKISKVQSRKTKPTKKLTAEEKRLANVTKLNAWFKHFTNENCKATFLKKTESAKRAGYDCKKEDYYRHIGCENFHKLADKITQWFDEVGLSENALRKKLLSLMEAKETKFFSTPEKDENGATVDWMAFGINFALKVV